MTAPPSIRNLIELGSEYAERRFAEFGEIQPRFIAVTVNSKILYVDFPPTPSRDEGYNLVRELFLAKDVVAYVFIDEAWTAFFEQGEPVISAAERPDRREVVLISAESEQEGQRYATRAIVRPADSEPYLDALIMSDSSGLEGRAVGLLARRTTLQ